MKQPFPRSRLYTCAGLQKEMELAPAGMGTTRHWTPLPGTVQQWAAGITRHQWAVCTGYPYQALGIPTWHLWAPSTTA